MDCPPARRVVFQAGLVAACLILLAAAGLAHAHNALATPLSFAQPLSAGYAVSGQPGLRAPAASPQQIAASLKATTGLTPSQVTTQSVCSRTAQNGEASCDAQVLVTSATHRLIHPALHAHRTFTVVTAKSSAGPFAIATPAPAGPPTPTTPAYLQQAYDLSYLSQTAGAGDTVAIVDAYDDPSAEADLGVFRSQWGLPPCTTANGCFRRVNQAGQSSPLPAADQGWAEEISLDVDAVSSLCPNCHILLVEANTAYLSDLSAAISAAQNLGARQISNSYGAGSSSPSGMGPSGYPGVSMIASTGDHGYMTAGVDAYPASEPGFTAAGGTSLSGTSTGLRGYAESAWSLNNGWGGTSGCNTQITKPTWQTDTGCTGRSYADVSADADPNTGLSIYDSGAGGWLLMGGTSLSSPLIAAYEAVTGVNGNSAQWAYQNAALLNDPATGNTGSCAPAIAYICNAQPGYDGPTGAGSISGAVSTGAPGIGGPTSPAGTYTQAQTVSSATLSAGLYPNGLATTYHWEYGTSTAYGAQTASQTVPAGNTPVAAAAPLTGLTAQTTYHYRLVATNADGTYYGYDYTLTTNGTSPVSSAAPTISGTPTQGQVLTTTNGSWNPPTGETFTYQWQRSPDGQTWTPIAGATNATYTLSAADVGDEIEVVVTAANSYGSGQATSGAVGPVASGAPHVTGQVTVSGATSTGNVLNANSTWTPAPTGYAYQWKRSTDNGTTWTAISGAISQAYTLGQADEQDLLEVTVTATNQFGSASATSAAVGPITSNPPVSTAAPTIAGTSQRTFSLTATAGHWNGIGNVYAYQWQSSPDGSTWSNISGATSSTHLLGVGDEGLQERVLITASNVDGITTATSGASQTISANPPGNQTPPAISGTAERTYTLTATQGVWVGPDNTYTFQWQENFGQGFRDIYGATTATYTLTASDEGATMRVLVTATNPDGSVVEASQPTPTVIAALPINTAPPTVTGTAARLSVLSANQGSWSGQGNSYALQWQHSSDGNTWSDISGATGATYAIGVADENTYVRVMVTATNADGTAQVPSAATALIRPAPPTNQTAPSVAGTAMRGMTLTSTPGTWQGIANSYADQWQRSPDGQNWTSIAGATSATYTLATADEGDRIRLQITASNADGTVTANSNATLAVQSAAPVNTAVPVVSGSLVRGATLTSTLGTWSGIGNTYALQWQRSPDGQTWTDIGSATSANYTLTPADSGDHVRLAVTATNPDAIVVAYSAASGVVASAPPVNTAAPTISGTLTRSSGLSSTAGTWSGLGNAYALQWQRSPDGQNWSPIAGATNAIYVLTTADEGDHMRLAVTASNPDGTATVYSSASAPISAAPPLNTALPAISGATVRGQTLTTDPGAWLGVGNAYSYQWQSSPDNGTTWTSIHAATTSSYALGLADEGSQFRVVVTAANPDATVTATSAPTSVVAAVPPVNTVAPTITGSAQRGQTLAASQGSWTGTANTYAYQWERDSGSGFTPITGATAATYTITAADEGARLEITVTAANPDGTVTASSTATPTIPSAPPANTVAPALSGSATRGLTLTGTQGTWTGIANTYASQWQRSTDAGTTWTDIPGAVSGSYTLTVADEGAEMRLAVIASNVDAVVTATSTATATVQASPPVNTAAPTFSGTAQRSSVLTATQGTWSGQGNTITIQWQRSPDALHWLTISGATGASYTVSTADENYELRALVTATNVDATASIATPATQPITSAPPTVSTGPVISGTAQRASVLTASQGTWTGIGNAYTQQWQRSLDGGSTWTDITGAVSGTYMLGTGDEGSQLRVAVTATNPDGTLTVTSAPTTMVAASPPVATANPSVSGAAVRGSTLSAATGAWSGAGNAYAYQWQSSADLGHTWSDIPGATRSTYPLTVADENHNIRIVVTAINPDATVAAPSPATAAVQAAPPVSSQLPTIAGSPRVGSALTAAPGTWTPPGATFTYQWQAGSSTAGYQNIAGATTASFTVTSAQVGQSVRVVVSASNPDGSTSATSLPTVTVTAPPQSTTAPAAPSGTLQDASTLTADNGTWDASASFTYQWVRCAVGATAVTGACTNLGTGQTYTLTGLDVGSPIGVRVTATNAGGSATANSALTAAISGRPLTNTSAPYISGNPQVPNTLTANSGQWSVALTGVSFTWQRCDAQGANCATVATNQSTYVLSSVDAGHTIVIDVAAASPGRTATAVSRPLLVSAQPLPQPSSLPVITGTAARASTLSFYPGTWTNSPTSVTYQWQACDAQGQSCQDIPGATATSYVPTLADEGKTITVLATARNASGTGTATAAVTAVIAPALPTFTATPTLNLLTGGSSPAEDAVLTTINGQFRGPAGTTLSVAWERCDSTVANCSAIPGATGANYQLGSADVGHTIEVIDTASNVDGSVTSTSRVTAVVAPAAPRWLTLPVIAHDPGGVGDVIAVTPGTWSVPAPSSDIVQMMRCTNVCTLAAVLSGANPTYTVVAADAGAVLRVAETAANATGHTSVWSSWFVGPVGSTVVAAGTIAGGSQVALRNNQGRPLAYAQVSAGAGPAAAADLTPMLAAHLPALVLRVRSAKGVSGRMTAWACPVLRGHGGAPLPCTAKITFTRGGLIALPAWMDAMANPRYAALVPAADRGRLRIVVKRVGR